MQTDIEVLDRIFGSSDTNLPVEVAKYFLGLSLTDTDQERIAALSEKANEGTLATDERDELSMYVLLCDLLTVLQSRAKASLRKPSPAA